MPRPGSRARGAQRTGASERTHRALERTGPTTPRTIADLPGLGPKSQAMLADAGIRTVARLERLGSVRAYAQVKASGANASLNLLWALEGALTGVPWQQVARECRLSLLLALEAHERQRVAV